MLSIDSQFVYRLVDSNGASTANSGALLLGGGLGTGLGGGTATSSWLSLVVGAIGGLGLFTPVGWLVPASFGKRSVGVYME